MKKAVTGYSIIAIALSMTAMTARGVILTYNGDINASILGSSVGTTLPMFDSSLGTLTGVQITLDFSATPFAEVFNASGGSLTFGDQNYTSGTLGPDIGNWTISYGSDNWLLTAPSVTTGDIYGSGQVLSPFTGLTFVGASSAPVDLTGASGLDFAAYIGGGTLTFGTTGLSHFSGGGSGPFYSPDGGFGGSGANLSGTASVTYIYTPVPEPTMLALAGLGALSLLAFRRRL